MARNPSGMNANDPFFNRMMDERIATLRAFLQLTAQKYDVPGIKSTTTSIASENGEDSIASSNIVPLVRPATSAR